MCGFAASTASIENSLSKKSGTKTSMTMPGFSSRTFSIVWRKCSAPPSFKSSRATAVMTTCFSFIRRVASATRAGSSASSASGLAVLTAQKPHARVQRSPAIMNVAVPLLQHSQWLGHLALSQTVWSFSSSSSERVSAKLSDVGSGRRSHSGRRARGFGSARFETAIFLLQLLPEIRKLVRTEVRQDFTIQFNFRGKFLAGKADHFVISRFIGDNVDLFIVDAALIEPVGGLMAPTAVRLYEQSDPFRFHTHTLVEL